MAIGRCVVEYHCIFGSAGERNSNGCVTENSSKF
jgi:hypothetical protein